MCLKVLGAAFVVLAFLAGYVAGHYAGFAVAFDLKADLARKRLKVVPA